MKRGRTKSSLVWKYFDIIEDKKVRCKICNTEYSFCGSTTTLSIHLQKHQEIDYVINKRKPTLNTLTWLMISVELLLKIYNHFLLSKSLVLELILKDVIQNLLYLHEILLRKLLMRALFLKNKN